jgi:hypothetical protein
MDEEHNIGDELKLSEQALTLVRSVEFKCLHTRFDKKQVGGVENSLMRVSEW